MKFLFILIFGIFLITCKPDSNKKDKEELENKAYNAYKSGDFTSSVNYHNQLIKEDSSNGQYYFGRASAYVNIGKNKDAIKDFLKSVQLNYRKGSCYFNIGLLNTYTNDSVAAIYFKKALDIYPKNEIKQIKKEDIQREYNECLSRLKTKSN